MSPQFSRRRFLNATTVAAAATAGFVSPEERVLAAALAEGADRQVKPPASGASSLPTGKLGKLTISRLISGGNLLSGWCHQRDLLFVSQLAQAYLTETKQFDTLELLEQSGVNAMVIDMIQADIVTRYKKERGGRIQTIVAVREDWGSWEEPDWRQLKPQIDRAIQQGPGTLFLHGGYCDRLVQAGKPGSLEVLGKAMEYIRSQGFGAGLGSHALEVPQACDRAGLAPDFYFKTFHHDRYWSATPKDRRKRFCVDGPQYLDHNEFHDNIFCIDPEATIEYMLEKKQPWIAYKVLAAGAIHPRSGFKYAFENGADFLAVGMFDFNVAEDVQIACEVLRDVNRERPWMA